MVAYCYRRHLGVELCSTSRLLPLGWRNPGARTWLMAYARFPGVGKGRKRRDLAGCVLLRATTPMIPGEKGEMDPDPRTPDLITISAAEGVSSCPSASAPGRAGLLSLESWEALDRALRSSSTSLCAQGSGRSPCKGPGKRSCLFIRSDLCVACSDDREAASTCGSSSNMCIHPHYHSIARGRQDRVHEIRSRRFRGIGQVDSMKRSS